MNYLLLILLSISITTYSSQYEKKHRPQRSIDKFELTRSESVTLVDKELTYVTSARCPNVINDYDNFSQSKREETVKNGIPEIAKEHPAYADWLTDIVLHDITRHSTENKENLAYLNALLPCYREGLYKTHKIIQNTESLDILIFNLHQLTKLQDIVDPQGDPEKTYGMYYTMATNLLKKRAINNEQAASLIELLAKVANKKNFYTDAHAIIETALTKKFTRLQLSSETTELFDAADKANGQNAFELLLESSSKKKEQCSIQ